MHGVAADISRHIWESKYRFAAGARGERSITDSWQRVARALAAVERRDAAAWERSFFEILSGFRFLPGGRILAGAGTGRNVTLFNCFVMGTIEDSIPGIFRALQEGAVTMQQGGGIGCDFSTLRPRGTRAEGSGSIASGPVSFMQIWDAMCGTILSTGARRGAMMATLRCDHPDIEEFVTAKSRPGHLHRFNLSILLSDAFMATVRADADWPLVFPATTPNGEVVRRGWPGGAAPTTCRIARRVSARRLWDLILRTAYDHSEPGVLFIDRINQLNNLRYRETINATNPCGEVPLPPYGACDLGSINLTRFVLAPFTPEARIDLDGLADTARVAVRLLDNVIDASRFPLREQAEQARGGRRIGLGVTGLADALVMLGLVYGSERSLALAADIMRHICHAAYRASTVLARDKGSFPFFQADSYLDAPFIRSLPGDIRDGIAAHGVRNSHLTAIAPTGTISLLAGNVSSGLEPIFADAVTRTLLAEDGSAREFMLTDFALDLWRRTTARRQGHPGGFATAANLPVGSHIAMQAALQPFVDNAISKTINVPEACPFGEFRRIFDLAYDQGLKGCTTFRPTATAGGILGERNAQSLHCCVPEREAD